MPETPPTTAPVVDIFQFARRDGELTGRAPVAAFARVASLAIDGEGEIGWHLRGRAVRRPEGGDELRLELTLDGRVPMQCVRCLRPVDVTLAASRTLRLAGTEAEAEREDLEDDESDVIAGSPRFAVGELVEDEAILALPFAARHEDCSLPGGGAAAGDADDDEPARPNPFAALAALKRGPS